MQPHFKIILFVCIFTCTHVLLSQKNTTSDNFKTNIKNSTASFQKPPSFIKARQFFINDQPDSVLVYTSEVLSTNKNSQELEDYTHFFRGYSLYKKEVLSEAENEFLKISNNFKFHYNVIAFLGTVTLENSEYEKALAYFKQIENIPEDKLLITNVSKVKGNIGVSYLHLQKYELAELYLKQSVALYEKSRDTIQLIGAYGNLASLFYEQYKDDDAIPFYRKAYNLAIVTDDFKSKQNTALNMAIVEENLKNYPKSIAYRKEYERWKDSVNDQNKIYAVAQAEKKIAIEKKEKQLVVLQAENKVKQAERNMYLYSAIILLVLLATVFYFYREKVAANKIIRAQKEDLDALNATKDKLFSIVSHDLRSSVNAIKTSNKKLIENLESQDIAEVKSLLHKNSALVNSAYNLLDNLLNWALLQSKQAFFQITKIRLHAVVSHVAYNYTAILAEKELSFTTKIDKKVVVYADQESLKIILRNLIDNAIKFTERNGKISLYSKEKNTNFYELIVEDSGVGMDEETRITLLKETALLSKKKHENMIGTGLGMQLCKSLLKKNNGSLHIESELNKGTKIRISLPKNLRHG